MLQSTRLPPIIHHTTPCHIRRGHIPSSTPCAPAPPRALSVPSATPRVCSIARVNFLCINGLIYVLQICSYPQFQLPLTQSRAAWGRGRCDRSRSFVYSFLIRCRAASV